MSDVEEKAMLPSRYGDEEQDGTAPLGFKSSGVARMEAISQHITPPLRVCIFISIFLIAFAYGLDSNLRNSYQTMATSNMQGHSLLATINVVRAAISVVAHPTMARVADIFGRLELLLVSVFFYALGTIIEATSTKISTFAAGAVLYQLGFTTCILLLEIIIADTTSLRSRVFFSYVPALCYLATPWISGDIFHVVTISTTWRWAIGMWAIIYIICALPLLLCLWWVNRKAKKAGTLKDSKTTYQQYGGWMLAKVLFWQLDFIGITILGSVLGLTLVPLTLAGGKIPQAHWGEARIVTPLVIGVLCIPLFIWWETKAPYPMIPFHLLKDRAVWGSLGIALHFNFAWACQSDYLFSVLIVAFNESNKSANRITCLYSFTSVLTGVILGLVIYRVRRLKPFMVFGTALFLVAFGLMIKFRGGYSKSSHVGIVAAQVVLGIAGGLFPYPAQASIQAATKHEHVAVVTGLYLACFNFGSALGNAVSGAIWTQILPRKLGEYFGESDLVLKWYNDPLQTAQRYPVGTPERWAVVESFKYVQRILCITGGCLCIVLIFFSLVVRNPRLPDSQSLDDAEDDSITLSRMSNSSDVLDGQSKKA